MNKKYTSNNKQPTQYVKITKVDCEIKQGCTNIPKIYSHLKILDNSWMT
jgi:hypothetical protein